MMAIVNKAQMNTTSHAKRSEQKTPRRKPGQTRLPTPYIIVVNRRGPNAFSCGFDLSRALLVGESLDERERRG